MIKVSVRTVMFAAGLLATVTLTGCPAQPPGGTGPIAPGDLQRTSTVNASGTGQDRTFTFDVKNTGGTAGCVAKLVVALRSTVPIGYTAEPAEAGVCLQPGETHKVTVSAHLHPGHWMFSAQWRDSSGTAHSFQDPSPIEYPLDVHSITGRTDSLGPDQLLLANDALKSNNGQYLLIMQDDGNLVLYTGASRAIWTSNTGGNPGAVAVMQDDGNLVVYSASWKPLWYTGTASPGSRVVLQPDGNLVVRTTTDAPIWATNGFSNKLAPLEWLTAGQWLSSSNAGDITLHMQDDGNLVLYKRGPAVWASNTAGHPGARATMQGDGNLVVYSADGAALWNSQTGGGSGGYAELKTDGNLVVYNAAYQAVWATNTGDAPPASSKVDAFVSRWNNACVDYDGAYGAQCVDLFNFYNRDVVGASFAAVNYAYQLWSTHDYGKYDQLSAGSTPSKGDVAIYDSTWGGGAGHVAIVLSNVDGSTIQVFDQNNPTGACARVHNISKSHLLGYLHPKSL